MTFRTDPYQIYVIENHLTGQFYVGCTQQRLADRFSQHACGSPYRRPLTTAILKFGRANFSIELLHKTDNLRAARHLEATEIRAHNALLPHGYNTTAVIGNVRFSRELGLAT
jgi:GIY-YIG catalytic domain